MVKSQIVQKQSKSKIFKETIYHAFFQKYNYRTLIKAWPVCSFQTEFGSNFQSLFRTNLATVRQMLLLEVWHNVPKKEVHNHSGSEQRKKLF